jgi:RNA polymerase sigma factor (sigma-70 family)
MDKSKYCAELLQLKPVALRATGGDVILAEDLLMEAIEIYLKSDVKINDLAHAKNFVSKTIYQLINQQNNEFNKIYQPRVINESIEGLESIEATDSEGRREYANNNLVELAMQQVYWYNRELLKLKMQGMSYREIAAHTGIKHGSVFVAIDKAKKQIKDYLNIND